MRYSCRYLTDSPKDYRVAVLDSFGVEYILRVLGHPAKVNPIVEIVGDCNLISDEKMSELIAQALKFHFDIPGEQFTNTDNLFRGCKA